MKVIREEFGFTEIQLILLERKQAYGIDIQHSWNNWTSSQLSGVTARERENRHAVFTSVIMPAPFQLMQRYQPNEFFRAKVISREKTLKITVLYFYRGRRTRDHANLC